MLNSYLTVKQDAKSELIIKKSKFIAHVAPVSTVEQAESFIAEIKAQHREATHNVYAFAVGDNGAFKKASDDGEPSGTAGRPVLDVINNKGLQDVAVVVTRYFGGKLLGAGGLIRAYSQAAAQGTDLSHPYTTRTNIYPSQFFREEPMVIKGHLP
ncbi:MAG: YigZ family protein [Bacillota bacterium]